MKRSPETSLLTSQHTPACCTRLGVAVLFACLGAALFLALPSHTSAATTLPPFTEIATSAVWTAAASPYLLEGRLTVLSGATLTLEPGTTVKFEDGATLRVFGTLHALGATDAPIHFTSAQDDTQGGDTNADGSLTEPSPFDDWGITLLGGGAHTITHATISYSDDGLYAENTTLSLEHVSVADVGYGIAARGSALIASNLDITRVDGDALVGMSGSALMVSGLSIDGTLGDALALYDHSTLDLSDALVRDVAFGSALGLYSSDAVIRDATFSGGLDDGIELYGNRRRAETSHLSLERVAVEHYFGTGIALFDGTLTATTTSVNDNGYGVELYRGKANIALSGITDNLSYGAANWSGSPTTFDARNNWWGDAAGPYHALLNPDTLGDEVTNYILFDPWLTEDSTLAPDDPAPLCCSNVLFLPGVQASRLYVDDDGERQLWEPNKSSDIRALYLNNAGESITTSIYTRDVIDETNLIPPPAVFGFNIYKGFITFMDGLVATGTIAAWEAAPYDWRMGITDVLERGVALENGGHYNIIEKLETLATTSRTGKVTLIAHSNGGLLAKALMDALRAQGKETLVDKLILVATPGLGTPKAALSLLHGDDQEIPKKMGFIVSREEARELGENMNSAYTLLPSPRYYDTVLDPVIEFDDATLLTEDWRRKYGLAINQLTEATQFLLGDLTPCEMGPCETPRTEPAPEDTDTPNVLDETLLIEAQTIQETLDTWQPPETLEVYEIAGWGLDTLRGIYYTERQEYQCTDDLSVCAKTAVLDREPVFTTDGDRTVVTPSALGVVAGAGRFYVDLFQHNRFLEFRKNREHADITEVESVLEVLSKMLSNESFEVLPEFVTREQPTGGLKKLRLRVLSPVSIDIYDEFGSHTGRAQSTTTDLDLVEEQIPSSYYVEIGEGKYVGLDAFPCAEGSEPCDGSYTVQLTGISSGTFTLEIREVQGEEVIGTLTYRDIPVAEGSKATLVIHRGIASSSPLMLDMDGDGVVDISLGEGESVGAIERLELLRQFIKTLGLPNGVENSFVAKIAAAITSLEKGNKSATLGKLTAFQSEVRAQAGKAIMREDAEALLKMIEQVREVVVQ